MLGDVRVPVGNPCAAFAMLIPLAPGGEDCVFPGPGRGDRVAKRSRHGLPGQFVQRRFGIEQIEMAGPAFHEQPNDGFGLGRVVRLFWREGIRGCGGAQFRRQAGLVEQMAQRQRPESTSPAAQKLAPRSGRQDMRLWIVRHQIPPRIASSSGTRIRSSSRWNGTDRPAPPLGQALIQAASSSAAPAFLQRRGALR